MASNLIIELKSFKYFKESNVYSAEFNGFRYKILKEKITIESEENSEDEKQEKTIIKAAVWPCPYSMDKTDSDLIKCEHFEFTKAGLDMAAQWIKVQYENDVEYWNKFNTGRIF